MGFSSSNPGSSLQTPHTHCSYNHILPMVLWWLLRYSLSRASGRGKSPQNFITSPSARVGAKTDKFKVLVEGLPVAASTDENPTSTHHSIRSLNIIVFLPYPAESTHLFSCGKIGTAIGKFPPTRKFAFQQREHDDLVLLLLACACVTPEPPERAQQKNRPEPNANGAKLKSCGNRKDSHPRSSRHREILTPWEKEIFPRGE